jgi:hypothetical protein
MAKATLKRRQLEWEENTGKKTPSSEVVMHTSLLLFLTAKEVDSSGATVKYFCCAGECYLKEYDSDNFVLMHSVCNEKFVYCYK